MVTVWSFTIHKYEYWWMQCIFWTRHKCWGFEFSLPIQFLIRLSCTYFSFLSLIFTTVLCLFHSNYELLIPLCVVFSLVLTIVKLILHFSASLKGFFSLCSERVSDFEGFFFSLLSLIYIFLWMHGFYSI